MCFLNKCDGNLKPYPNDNKQDKDFDAKNLNIKF